VTRVQADVQPSIMEWLDGQGLGAIIRENVDPEWTTDDDPLLIVADDGGPVRWPIKSQHTIRLTAWAAGRTEARRIVALAAGKLGTGRPDGVVHVNAGMGGILDARDKTTGARLASVLVIVHARTVEV
jgi:hypothetical protein